MPVKSERSTRFADEIRIISPWAYGIAALGVVVVVVAMVFAHFTDKSGDRFFTLPVLVPVGLLGAAALVCYILLIGYVNADAGRRGMSRIGWTLLAMFVPNALGVVLYFVLRKPRVLTCPQCDAVIEPGFGFCPRCRHRLNAICPQCQRGVHESDKFCPYCSADLGSGVNPPSVPVANRS